MTRRELGDHTRNTGLLFLPEDERSFGEAVAQRLPGAAWRCSQPGGLRLHPSHLHPDVASSLACGPIQAFLHLPIGSNIDEVEDMTGRPPTDSPTAVLAIVQLLRSPVREGAERGMRLGRLAVKWNVEQVGPPAHEMLTEQVARVWAALRATATPAHLVSSATGKTVKGRRVGPAARRWILAESMPVWDWGPHLRLEP